jgi:hypothetical protein
VVTPTPFFPPAPARRYAEHWLEAPDSAIRADHAIECEIGVDRDTVRRVVRELARDALAVNDEWSFKQLLESLDDRVMVILRALEQSPGAADR